jgi:hypothetical protein
VHLWNSEEAVENSKQRTLVSGYLLLQENFCDMLLHSQLSSRLDGKEQHSGWGFGYPIGNDGLWLDGHTIANKHKTERFFAIKFGQRRALLAKDLRVFCKRGPITK